MALGDNFGVIMGATNDTRQPAAGVFEKITAIGKGLVVDSVILTDATLDVPIYDASIITQGPFGNAASPRGDPRNVNIRIGNVNFIEKTGTTDVIHISGVQTDV